MGCTNLNNRGNNSLITSNTIFTNGKLDPWQALSVTKDLSSSVPAILVADTGIIIINIIIIFKN